MNIKKSMYKRNNKLQMCHSDPSLSTTMSDKIISWFPRFPRDYVAVCIGTDRSTGDSLGPLVGTFFQEYKPKHINIHGTLHNPVHAKNLKKHIQIIHKKYKNPFIIAIDASLGRSKSVGLIISGVGSIKPGAALNKDLPSIGNIYITGVVNISGFMEYAILQNTRLSVVVDMAKNIAEILNIIDQQLINVQTPPSILVSNNYKQQFHQYQS